MVLPIFIFSVLAFIYFLEMIKLQEELQNAITETGFYSAKHAYVYDYLLDKDSDKVDDEKSDNKKIGNKEDEAKDESGVKESIEQVIARTINSSFYKVKLKDYIEVDKIDKSIIKGGFDGIQTYLSTFMEEDSVIDIIITYKIKLPLLFIHIDEIPVIQRVRMRGWNGYKVKSKIDGSQEEDKNEEIVYITPTGMVYHLTKKCSYVTLSIRLVDISQVDIIRNTSGGKYKQCRLCDEISQVDQVYVTDYGDRYHQRLDCSGLKRTILTIHLSEVGERRPCTRCRSTTN